MHVRVSVVIPNYNHAAFLGGAVESALGQTHADVEVIVVDDGSTDGSAEVIAAFGHRVQSVFKENGGPASARNEGLRRATGRFLIFLDSDDALLPSAVRDLLDCFERFPDAGLVFGNVIVDEADRRRRLVETAPPCGYVYNRLLESNFVLTSATMLRRAAIDSAGWFDTDPGLFIVEDYDMWKRIARAHPIYYTDTPVVVRREHGANISADSLRLLENERYMCARWLSTEADGGARRAIRRHIGRLHHEMAYHWRCRGESGLCRRNSLRGACYTPFFWKHYAYLLFPKARGRWDPHLRGTGRRGGVMRAVRALQISASKLMERFRG